MILCNWTRPWRTYCGNMEIFRRARQWLDDVKEWTGLSSNGMWKGPEDRVAWRKRVSRVATNGLVYGIQDSRRFIMERRT